MNLVLDWRELLKYEFQKYYFKSLINIVKYEYKNYICYPPINKIFAAFNICSFNNIKVVILGQDPYIYYNQANGLCFSVSHEIKKLPPSLNNIFYELYKNNNVVKNIKNNGDLSHWARQGVLLMNSILTVRSGISMSHKNIGWEVFTDSIIKLISSKKENIVFILWGNYAKNKEKIIDAKKHFILKSSHPSPYSVNKGFYGCKHFLKTNIFLEKKGYDIIYW